jgi:hypothetical protein
MSTPGAEDTQSLPPEAAARLGEFARACKAAARAVTLYPPAHPAIRVSLDRLADVTDRAAAEGPLTLTVLPDNLLMDARAAARPDSSIGELARILHGHLVGALTIHASPDVDAWRPFLLLLARPPEEVRHEGGLAKLWALTGARHIEIREIDYAEILRERAGGHSAHWDQLVQNCLQTDAVDLDEKTLQALLEVAGDADRLAELVLLVEERATGHGGIRSQTAALLRMLRGIVEIVSRTDPQRLEPVLGNMAVALGGLSPRLVLELLSKQHDRADAAADLVLQVVSRMTDGTIAGFVANSVVAERGATGRLAQAFQTLVPEADRRPHVIEMAESAAAQSPLGREQSFPELWKNAADMLASYSDDSFVSDAYAHELSGVRTQAVEVERVSDDPPDRISKWLTSVNDSELRGLDLQLLLDLLAIEADPERWREITQAVIVNIEDLALVGDFEAALRLVNALVAEVHRETPNKAAAAAAVDSMVEGSMIQHLADMHTLDDQSFDYVKRIAYALGPAVVPPLAETLSVEQRGRNRQRLTELLLGFGAAGRQSVERLKNSANPAVRRTAIYLLREFGGAGALPDLTTLLDDAEPHVQREALRAILLIGTEEAYSVLQRALASGTDRSRNSLMLALVAMHDERAAPLFEYIVRNVDYRGVLRGVYLRAVESLGTLRTGDAVGLLKDALYRGEWWAPFRTATLRRTAAAALRQIGTGEALQVLEDAAERGPGGIRAAARAARAGANGPAAGARTR